MKITPQKTLFIFLFLVSVTHISKAQQNLFNIPSGDITPKNKVFYQHQLNFYDQKFDTKSHLVYGIGKNMDVGVNFLSKKNTFSPFRFGRNDNLAQGSMNPILVLTAQKQIPLNGEKLHLNVGTQAGTNLARGGNQYQFSNFNYGILVGHLGEKSRIVGGGYYANPNYQGTKTHQTGVLVGFEWHLTDKWYAMGDWVSGKNDIGEGVIGGMYIASKRVQICGGLLVPNQFHKAGIVFELNILGWDYH